MKLPSSSVLVCHLLGSTIKQMWQLSLSLSLLIHSPDIHTQMTKIGTQVNGDSRLFNPCSCWIFAK